MVDWRVWVEYGDKLFDIWDGTPNNENYQELFKRQVEELFDVKLDNLHIGLILTAINSQISQRIGARGAAQIIIEFKQKQNQNS